MSSFTRNIWIANVILGSFAIWWFYDENQKIENWKKRHPKPFNNIIKKKNVKVAPNTPKSETGVIVHMNIKFGNAQMILMNI